MTIETKTSLEPKDIKGIEFECLVCHARMLFPVDKFRPPTRCINCEDAKQWLVIGSTEWEDLQRLGQLIQRLSKSEAAGFKVRLEIETPTR